MHTWADGLAVAAAWHACALPAGGVVLDADVVGAAVLVLPAALLRGRGSGWRGVSTLGDAGVCTFPRVKVAVHSGILRGRTHAAAA